MVNLTASVKIVYAVYHRSPPSINALLSTILKLAAGVFSNRGGMNNEGSVVAKNGSDIDQNTLVA